MLQYTTEIIKMNSFNSKYLMKKIENIHTCIYKRQSAVKPSITHTVYIKTDVWYYEDDDVS